MSKKRQIGSLHNLHIRISTKDYQQISEICERLNITFADYFSQIIHADGYEKLQMLARRINKEPRNCKIEMSVPTKESIDGLSATLNNQATQIRRIGTNLSNLISKITDPKTDFHNPALLRVIIDMKCDLDVVLEDVHKASSRLVNILYDDATITKTEYIGHDIWDE